MKDSIFPPCSCNQCAACFGRQVEERRAVRAMPPGFAVFVEFVRRDESMSTLVAAAWMLVDAIADATRERIAIIIEQRIPWLESEGCCKEAREEEELARWIREGGEDDETR